MSQDASASRFEISRRTLLSTAFQTGVVLALDSRIMGQTEDHAEFKSILPLLPRLPDSARPWVYWFWFNGDVSREGLTADLEAMHAIGIGGAIILCTGFGSQGPVRYMSPLWYEMIHHVLAEARRLGMQIDLNNDDGWSDAAGPWIPPELAMHKVVWTETVIAGGKRCNAALALPEAKAGFYCDVAVVAFPATAGSDLQLPVPKLSAAEGKPSTITHDYGVPITVRSAEVQLWAEPIVRAAPVVFNLEASMDGEHFTPVYHFDNHWRWTAQEVNRTLWVSVHFRAVTARYFRIVVPYTARLAEKPEPGHKPRPNLQTMFTLNSEDHLALWQLKAGYRYTGATLEQPEHYAGGWADQFIEQGSPVLKDAEAETLIGTRNVLQLTGKMVDGKLDWDAPPGQWTVLRVGYTIVGAVNHIASKEGLGYIVNPFTKEAMDLQFASDLEKVIRKNWEFVGNALYAFHMDSSESGPSNWSPAFAAEFEVRRGYSLLPWLPVLAGGRVVGSIEQSDRFLWDFRRTMSDLMAENCWGRLATLSHQHGGVFTAEASGRMQFMSDPLLYLSKGDVPMGEFWPGEADVRPDCLNCRSVANVHGKKVVLGEAFTSASWAGSPNAGEWQDHPYLLKAFGDRAFCAGVNRYVFHRSISQSKLHDFPGTAWGPKTRHVGINMERTNTWWYPGQAWISYLSRSQYLLQAGREVVDICVLTDEGAPSRVVQPEGLPAGYKFDGLHHTMLAQVSVRNGELVLPSGMRYRMLVLPPLGKMRPATAREVQRLSTAGACIIGTRPTASPSLENYPACDAEISRIVASWQTIYPTVAEAIQKLGLRPDFVCRENVLFMHRSEGSHDHYFVSNQTDAEIRIDAEFRLNGRAPELLDPDTGVTTTAALYRSANGVTTVPLVLDPAGSVFVFFRKPAGEAIAFASKLVNNFGTSLKDVMLQTLPDRITEVTTAAAGDILLRTNHGRMAILHFDSLPERKLTGPWKLTFPPNWGAPAEAELPKLISWSEHPDEGIRHFSGTATYSIDFDVAADELVRGRAVYLNLGEVEVMAELILNGKALGTRWKPPFRWELTADLKAGKNALRITVTNLWPNRLIGDSALPVSRRFTKTNFNPYEPDSPLFRSGLLGPVVLTFAHREIVRWK